MTSVALPNPLPPRALIGMVHVQALPGSPFSRRSVGEITAQAVNEAKVLAAAGFDAMIIENMHDRPYVQAPHGPETVAAMTRVGLACKDAAPKLVMGVQILSGGTAEALAVAQACEAEFVRVENFVFAHVADEGLLPKAEAGPLLRYRARVGAEGIAIFADIKKKHASHAVTADLSIEEIAEGAELFGADGLIVTGQATGKPTSADEVKAVKRAVGLPVLVGSGVTERDAAALLRHADALIIGSSLKVGGVWSNPLDPAACKRLVKVARTR